MLKKYIVRFVQGSLVTIAIIQILVLFISITHSPPVRAQASEVPDAVSASSMPFHLYDDLKGLARKNQVSDLPQELTGVVIAVWSADTAQNRRVCQSRWLFNRATETLCASLARHKIVSFRTDTAGPDLVAYVAVSQTLRLANGERVRVLPGRQNSDGTIFNMPVLTARYPQTNVDSGSLSSR